MYVERLTLESYINLFLGRFSGNEVILRCICESVVLVAVLFDLRSFWVSSLCMNKNTHVILLMMTLLCIHLHGFLS